MAKKKSDPTGGKHLDILRMRLGYSESRDWKPRGNRGVRFTKTKGRQFQQPAPPDRGK
jgi:hypothetical protein